MNSDKCVKVCALNLEHMKTRQLFCQHVKVCVSDTQHLFSAYQHVRAHLKYSQFSVTPRARKEVIEIRVYVWSDLRVGDGKCKVSKGVS